MRPIRLTSIAGGAAFAALLSACSTSPSVPVSVNVPPPTVVNAPAPVAAAPMSLEYGRVVSIDYYAGGVSSAPSIPGAIIGGVAGAVLGNQIGGGSGRDAATVLGAVGGAAVGSQVGRGATAAQPTYRVTVQTDQGTMRYYDVGATGDLRVGDRVRVENGVIYRS
ncbi:MULTISPECIES: glycine zipper 2TM domain-containing protein [Ramlibacter]|nr:MULTISPECIES: glycine zipper 2TM domain-containing protein [Ramlibacter]